ncbi:hypothetical protein [Hasllibacter sp. MH4015]|uniref:hypothetical protein n=1 Tax=Hasllibacter sp. MH4015 TaxID=2854029 RepID=UPI001CD56C77|nr:hypothetical protein [Hasllibacter sp. MH4015]
MTLIEILGALEPYQTTIVGALGFIGVIWTLRTNARHAAAAHEREIDTRRRALRRVLAAEFRNDARALRENSERKVPPGETISVGRSERAVSNALDADIGLLDLDEIDVVMNAIISRAGMNHLLENMAVVQSNGRFVLPATAFDDFCDVASTTAKAMELAVQALEYSGDA